MAAHGPIVSDGDLLQVLRGFNPWWRTGRVPGARRYRRVAFYEAQRWLQRRDLRRAVMLAGARRVGKTTILYQLAEEALTGGLPPRRCLYLSFDHPLLKLTRLDRLVDLFRSEVATGEADPLLLLDEIHYASDWAAWLKWLVDGLPAARVAATGSASSVIKVQGQESGAGRWAEIAVPTLSFYEYAHLAGLRVPDLPPDALPSRLPQLAPGAANEVLELCLPLRPHLPRYLLQGGFPEAAQVADLESAQRVIREDVVDRVLKRDMTALYAVRSVLEMERLFVYCCLHSGGIIAQERVASELGVSRATVGNLLAALEAAHLLHRCLPVAAGGKKSLKPRTKIYLADPSIRSAVLLKGEELLGDAIEAGLVMETAVHQHVRGLYLPQRPQVGYWRDPAGHEVDLVVAPPGRPMLAVEVKYREGAAPDVTGLRALCRLEPGTVALVVTKHPAQFGSVPVGDAGAPFQVPAFAFLYLMGHAERVAVDDPSVTRLP